jgi:hypothetical protein
MEIATMDKKFSWGALVGTVVTLVTLIGGILAIVQYYQQNPIHVVTGKWTITDKTEQTSYSPYKNLQVTYTVTMTQSGNELTGSGTKTTESGHPLTGKEHTPIEIKGEMDGGSIVASFTEQGADRQALGGFTWNLASDGKWVGTFYSDAANSSGTSTLSR